MERRGHSGASTRRPASSQSATPYVDKCELAARGRAGRPASLGRMTPEDADALVAAELAELEELAAALSAVEVEGVAPVQGPQDWS
jgi:hypothetical protein